VTTVVNFDDGSDLRATAFVRDDQTFTLNLSPGHYYLLDRFTQHGYIVRNMELEGRDVLEDGFSIVGPGKLSLEITLSKDGGRVDGVVADKDGKPMPGATVVLVPEAQRRSHGDLFQNAEADQRGQYKFEAITPGDYKIFAWHEVEEGIWQDPDFLKIYESKGEPVTIRLASHEVRTLAPLTSR
jgi:hypothetical protein